MLDEADVGKRPVAVDVNNIQTSKPQYGVSRADIVYEMETEYGITRLLCLYYDIGEIGQIGSVRSTRENLLALAYPLDPVFVYVGNSIYAQDAVAAHAIDALNALEPGYNDVVYRDEERLAQGYPYESSAMTTGERIVAACEDMGISLQTDQAIPAFLFADPDGDKVLPADGEAQRVYFWFSGEPGGEVYYDGDFRYDSASGQYLKFQHGEAQMDVVTGQQMAFDNVFVLFGDIAGRSSGDILLRFEYEAGGTGYYFSQGRYAEFTWEKDSFSDNFMFYDAATGEELVVNCGNSYVAVVNKSKAPLLEIA